MHCRRPRTVVVSLYLSLSLACGGRWQAVPLDQPKPLPARQLAEVWSLGERKEFWGVRITGDSLSGRPAKTSPRCTTCRVTLPLSTVDSLRTWQDDKTGLIVIVSVFTAALIAFAVICGDNDNGGCRHTD